MRVASSRVLSVLIVAVAVSCASETREEEGRPATFGAPCMLDGLDPCQDPFVCLALPDFSTEASSMSICTVACQSTEDCPSWQSSEGPCSGDVQSECIRQICRDLCR